MSMGPGLVHTALGCTQPWDAHSIGMHTALGCVNVSEWKSINVEKKSGNVCQFVTLPVQGSD